MSKQTKRTVAGRTMKECITIAFGDRHGNVSDTILHSRNAKAAILSISGITRVGKGATLKSKTGNIYYGGTDEKLREAALTAYRELTTPTGRSLNGSAKMDLLRNIMSRGI